MLPVGLGRPISGNCVLMLRPPRSNTRKTSPGGITLQRGSGYIFASAPRARSLSVNILSNGTLGSHAFL